MVCQINREIVCILTLSISFMLLFAADFTMTNMQKIFVNSIVNEQPDFNLDGYTVNGLVYSVFAISLWFGPYVTYSLGPRLTMFLSAIAYMFSVGSYAVEKEWAIYSGAVIGGIGAGMLWPAQGQYMIENSSPKTTARNAGIFLFLYMISNMLGNLFVFFTFYGKTYINQSTRRTAVYILLGLNSLAIISFTILPKSISKHQTSDYGPVKTIRKSWNILFSPRMLCLTLSFCYAGLQQCFWDGIYSPSIGFTTAFGDAAKELVALSGIFMGIGSLVGSFFPIVFARWIRNHQFARRMIFLFGIIAQLSTYTITFINLPNNAVFGDTDDISLIYPSKVLAMMGSFLICFGDSCLTTQIYSIIGDFYRENSAEACALYKFIKGVFVAVCFYSSSYLGLHFQVIIMAVISIFGFFGFFMADRNRVSYLTKKQLKS